jgi:phosphatidylserine/phosphatidylglycerophosphate/cardiolipin synthase-like enzyme
MKGLRVATTAELRTLRAAIAGDEIGTPLTPARLTAFGGLGSVVACVDALAGLDAAMLLRVLDAILEERDVLPIPPRLVWSGPDVPGARAIGTSEALREIFGRATRSVLLAGYAFDHGKTLLEPLHTARMRGASVEIYLHVDEAPKGEEPVPFAKREVMKFLTNQWPWPERPEIYYDPRTASGNDGKHASMHAKCVVVDERWSLVGSANFTDRGHTRNVEVGALVDDAIFAREVLRQFHAARDLGLFVHWQADA